MRPKRITVCRDGLSIPPKGENDSPSPSSAVMENMPWARLFLGFYFTACDGVSVPVRIRRCLFSITLEFGVCCTTWLVEQIIEVICLPTQAVFDKGEYRAVVSVHICCLVD